MSIIIPAWNSAAFIHETLESVHAQTVTDREIIVVDDGSQDDTAEQASRHQGVTVIRQDNAGDSAARNTGLSAASGEFVMFLDHDDLLLPEAADLHLTAIDSQPGIDMTIGSNYTIDARGQRVGINTVPPRRFRGADVALGLTPSFSQCMYRKSALEKVGGLRPEAKSAADHDLNIRLLHNRDAGLVHHGFAMSYRLHEGQQTRSPSKLYRMHMATLEDLLGPDGQCSDPRLLKTALVHWKKYYGKFLPAEVYHSLRKGDRDRAAKAATLFIECLPEAAGSTLGFVAGKLGFPVRTSKT